MEHRFVKISYTGRIKDGSVFDTTDKETAEKEKIFDEKRVYRPVPVVIGEKQVLPGLDEELKEMKAGEGKEVMLPPEKAYGQKDPNLIRLVPMKAFKQQNMMPIPGMVIELDGRPAKIQTVSGGRVRVDFNAELAGKTLEYKIKIDDEAKTQDQRLKFLIERSFNTLEGFEVRINARKVEIVIPEKSYKDRNLLVRKASLVTEIFRFTDVDSVTYADTWKKKKKEDKKPEESKEESETMEDVEGTQ